MNLMKDKYQTSVVHIHGRLFRGSLRYILQTLHLPSDGNKYVLQTRLDNYLFSGYRNKDEVLVSNVYRLIMKELNPLQRHGEPSPPPTSVHSGARSIPQSSSTLEASASRPNLLPAQKASGPPPRAGPSALSARSQSSKVSKPSRPPNPSRPSRLPNATNSLNLSKPPSAQLVQGAPTAPSSYPASSTPRPIIPVPPVTQSSLPPSNNTLPSPIGSYSSATPTQQLQSSHASHTTTNFPGSSGSSARDPVPKIVFRETPFYHLKKILGRPTLIPITPGDMPRKITIRFTFTDEDIKGIKSRENAVLLLSAIIGETNQLGESLLQFPPQIGIRVNQQIVQVNVAGIKGKPGTARAPDITKYLLQMPRMANLVDITVQSVAKPFAMFSYLVEPVKLPDIVENIKKRAHISKEATVQKIIRDNNDDDVQAISTVLSLKCPLSYSRISLPVRSVYCDHIECFDALSFLMLQQQATTWVCPICNKSLQFNDLAVDEYSQEILEKVALYDIDEIKIEANGEWTMPKDAKLLGEESDESDSDVPDQPNVNRNDVMGRNKVNRPASFIANDAIVVTLSDSEDESGITIPPEPTEIPVSIIQDTNVPAHSSSPDLTTSPHSNNILQSGSSSAVGTPIQDGLRSSHSTPSASTVVENTSVSKPNEVENDIPSNSKSRSPSSIATHLPSVNDVHEMPSPAASVSSAVSSNPAQISSENSPVTDIGLSLNKPRWPSPNSLTFFDTEFFSTLPAWETSLFYKSQKVIEKPKAPIPLVNQSSGGTSLSTDTGSNGATSDTLGTKLDGTTLTKMGKDSNVFSPPVSAHPSLSPPGTLHTSAQPNESSQTSKSTINSTQAINIVNHNTARVPERTAESIPKPSAVPSGSILYADNINGRTETGSVDTSTNRRLSKDRNTTAGLLTHSSPQPSNASSASPSIPTPQSKETSMNPVRKKPVTPSVVKQVLLKKSASPAGNPSPKPTIGFSINPGNAKRTFSEVIDLTLSDDEDEPPSKK